MGSRGHRRGGATSTTASRRATTCTAWAASRPRCAGSPSWWRTAHRPPTSSAPSRPRPPGCSTARPTTLTRFDGDGALVVVAAPAGPAPVGEQHRVRAGHVARQGPAHRRRGPRRRLHRAARRRARRLLRPGRGGVRARHGGRRGVGHAHGHVRRPPPAAGHRSPPRAVRAAGRGCAGHQPGTQRSPCARRRAGRAASGRRARGARDGLRRGVRRRHERGVGACSATSRWR